MGLEGYFHGEVNVYAEKLNNQFEQNQDKFNLRQDLVLNNRQIHADDLRTILDTYQFCSGYYFLYKMLPPEEQVKLIYHREAKKLITQLDAFMIDCIEGLGIYD